MANIQKRTGQNGEVTYRVRVRLKGFPIQTASFKRLTDARKWGSQTEAAILEGRHFKTREAKKHTLGNLVDRYLEQILPHKPKSFKKQQAQIAWWREAIGDYTLADVTPALIAEARDRLLNELTHHGKRRSPATVNRYLAALSHAFTVACNEWEWIEQNPFRKVKKLQEARGRVRFLDDAERKRLLEVCRRSGSTSLYPIVLLAISTGFAGSTVNWSFPGVIRNSRSIFATPGSKP